MSVNKKNFFYVFTSSLLLTYLVYLFSIQVSKIYTKLIVPTGDPFSYEASLINLHNYSTFSIFNYIKGIFQTITSADWYYAYKIPIAFFSPFISNNHEDLLIVNYFYLFILIFVIQYYLKLINHNKFINSISLIIVFIFPFLWGYESYISINQLTLDTQVLLVSISYFFLLINFYHSYSSTNLAISTSIIGGLLFLTRGNSFTFFIILTLPTFFLFILRFFKFNNFKKYFLLKKITLPIVFFILIVTWFYYFTLENILNYYSVQTVAYDYSKIPFLNLIESVKIIFLNYPGAFFTNESFHAYTNTNFVYTILFYLLIIFSFFLLKYKSNFNIKYKKQFSLIRLCVLTILFSKIFELYGIPFFASGIAVRQIMYIPLIPFIVIIIILNINFWNFLKKILNKIFLNLSIFLYLIFILFFILINSFIQTNFKIPKKLNDDDSLSYMKRVVNPYELEKLSLEFENNVKIYSLFYNIYNPSIINYYRIKNKYNGILFNPFLLSDIIAPTVNNPNYRGGKEQFRKSLIEIFNDADYIILPKYIEDYKHFKHIIASQFYEIFFEVLSQKQSQKFRVIKELNDTIDLVLLKKTNNLNYDLYDGKKNYYKNIDLDIDLFRVQDDNLWFSFIPINNFFDFLNISFIKDLVFRNNEFKKGSIHDPNRMFDFDKNTFFEKPNDKILLLLNNSLKKPLKFLSVQIEDRSNKKNKNFHRNSTLIRPNLISISGSDDLENWSLIKDNMDLNYNENGLSRIEFPEKNSYSYLLIKLKSANTQAIRVYDFYINDNIDPSWRLKYLNND